MLCLFLMHQRNLSVPNIEDTKRVREVAVLASLAINQDHHCPGWHSMSVAVHVLLPDDSLIASRYLVCHSWEIYVRTIVGLVLPYFDITRVCVMMVENSLIPVRFLYTYIHIYTHFLMSFCSIQGPLYLGEVIPTIMMALGLYEPK